MKQFHHRWEGNEMKELSGVKITGIAPICESMTLLTDVTLQIPFMKSVTATSVAVNPN